MFSNKPIRPTVSSLGKESEGVLSVFRKALSNLSNINDKAQAERELKLAEIKQAQEDAVALKMLCEDNSAVISNINNLLNKKDGTK